MTPTEYLNMKAEVEAYETEQSDRLANLWHTLSYDEQLAVTGNFVAMETLDEELESWIAEKEREIRSEIWNLVSTGTPVQHILAAIEAGEITDTWTAGYTIDLKELVAQACDDLEAIGTNPEMLVTTITDEEAAINEQTLKILATTN